MRNASLFGRLGAVLLLIFCLAGLSGPSQAGMVPSLPKVLLLHSETDAPFFQDVKAKLEATGSFSSVGALDGRFSTPTLVQLQAYDVVLTWTDGNFQDPAAMGDVLADYMDAGRGVVIATFGFNSNIPQGIGGRIGTDGYLPFVRGTNQTAVPLTLVKNLASHPILQGVNSLSGGSSSYHQTVTLAPGATLVASWSNGRPLVATKKPTVGKIVGLNFHPPSSDVPMRSDLWTSSTDGARLMANSLLWTLSPVPVISNIQVSDIRTDRATVSWVTDIPVKNSVVEYGLTTAYGSTAASADGTGGVATLTGLQAGKTYHFRVHSTGQAGVGDTATSEDLTFVTVPAGSTQGVGVFVVRSGGQIVVYVTINNNSALPLNNLRITRGSLRGTLSTANTTTAPLPSLGNVAPGGTPTTRLAFPASVGDPGSPLTLSIGWGSSAGSGSGSFRLVYPGEPEPDA